MLVAYYQMIVC